jgi:1,5-anhydro-D-fructose reductase (1,5-anhydro-D-mannitol-forming)
MTIRAAIIGLGKFGRLRHRLLAQRDDVAIESYSDPHVESYPGLRRADAADILADPAIDAVVIAVPNVHVRRFVTEAIRQGKHVLCEKPPGVSLDDAQAIHAAQLEHPAVRVKFGFNHRFMSHYQRLREIVQSQQYGRALWVRGLYGKGFDAQFFEGWRSDRHLAGGGIFLDQGIHLLDLVMHLVGPVAVEHAMVDVLTAGGSPLEENVFALLRARSGIPITLCSSIVQWKHTLRLEVGTEQAIVVAEGIKSSTRSFGEEILVIHSKWHDNFVETHTSVRSEPDFYTLAREHEEFLGAIRDGTPVVNGTTDDAVALMRVVADVYRFRGGAS